MSEPLPNQLKVWMSLFDTENNVVFLSDREVAVGSCAFITGSGMNESANKEKAFNAAAARGEIPFDQLDFKVVPLSKLRRVNDDGRKALVELHYEQGGPSVLRCKPLLHSQGDRFVDVLQQRLGSGWERESRQSSRLIPILLNLGLFLLTLAFTIVLYLGIENGFINYGPRWLATIVLFLGTIGILIIGGFFTLLFLLFLVLSVFFPPISIELRKR